MVSLKKIAAVAASAAVVAAMVAMLSGCGEDVAATWAHGKIMEADITKAATKDMASHVKDDGSTDVDAWTKYIEDREYDTGDDEDADVDDAKDSKDSKDDEAENNEKGTVAEYREYLIKQKLRDEIVKYQIKEQKIEVTEEEIDAEVESEAAMYEAYYGGGMSGTFESIINNYFGMTMDDFRNSVSEHLAEQKLQEATVGSDNGDASEESAGDEAEDANDSKSDDSAEKVDYDKLFEEYLDKQVESADLKIKDCPADLSYDPAVVAKNAESSSSESSESSEDSNDSNAESSDSSSSDDAAKDDDTTTKEDK